MEIRGAIASAVTAPRLIFLLRVNPHFISSLPFRDVSNLTANAGSFRFGVVARQLFRRKCPRSNSQSVIRSVDTCVVGMRFILVYAGRGVVVNSCVNLDFLID